MALALSHATDYSIRAMIYLACLPEERWGLKAEIARICGIPTAFAAKVLQRLRRAGLLRSMRGAHGGFGLARPATSITLLDIVEALEGPIAFLPCAPETGRCEWPVPCPCGEIWQSVQRSMTSTLRAVTLEDLVSAPRRVRASAPR